MPSLMEAVLENADPDQDPIDFLDACSIDRIAVSEIEGGWERIETDPVHPKVDGLNPLAFDEKAPPVFEYENFIIVRGFNGITNLWFVFEPVGVHTH
jgi:hypothetical protein